MKTLLPVVFILLSFQCAAADELFSLYFVRHAEKDLSDGETHDPPLNECGVLRAERLVSLFRDIDLQAIYSTDFIRTRSTAGPTAESKKLPVRIYDPYELGQFVEELRARKQDTLVVGHSQTTSVLAGNMTGTELEEIDEAEYDRLYLVVVAENSAKLHLLNQAFECGP